MNDKIEDAIDVAFGFGQVDGSHHKMWVIDQMVRILTGDDYDRFVTEYRSGPDGPETYEWDVGVAP